MRTRLLVIISLSVALTLGARAADNNWTDGNGKWEIGANWSLGVPSTNTQSGISIINGGNNTVTLDATTVLSNGLNGCMSVSNLTLTANVLQLTNAALGTPLRILNGFGIGSGGALLVSNSAVRVDGEFDIDGAVMLKIGSISVTNPFPSSLHIGHGGFGQMTVSNGIVQASVEFVGYAGGSSGTLTLAGGTNLVTNGGLNISGFGGSTGTVWVTGGGLIVTNVVDINVGSSGIGHLTVSNGFVLGHQLNVGINPGSLGTVTTAGGSMIFTNASNTGSIDVRNGVFTMNGGLVAVDKLFVTNGASSVFRLNGGTLVTKSSFFSNGGPYVVVGDLGNSATLMFQGTTHSLTLGLRLGDSAGSTGTAWMTANQLVASNTAAYISIGALGVGQMTVSNGTWQGGLVYVGLLAGSSGTLTIAGGTSLPDVVFIGLSANATGAVWVTGGQLVATNGTGRQIQVGGNSGVGQMTVSNGTVLSDQVVVGTFGGSQGTLTMMDGTIRLSSILHVGTSPNSTGAVWVSGGQLVVTNGGTYVGESGIGQMTISNGTVLARDLTVGLDVTGTGTVVVTGGSLAVTNATNTGSIDVRRGLMTMNGGVVSVDQLFVTNVIASGFDLNGGVLTTKGTVISNNEGFVVGGGPTPATLNLRSGNHYFDFGLEIGASSGSTGAVWMTGGQLATSSGFGLIYMGAGGVGQMTLSNGVVSAPGIFLGIVVGAASGVGTLTMAGGTLQMPAGEISMGDSSGTTGAVWVVGSSANINGLAYLIIGDDGVGHMTLSNGVAHADSVYLGSRTGSGTLTMAGGELTASNVVVGDCASDAIGFVFVRGGDLFVTNAAHNAVLDVRNGLVLLTAGQLKADKIVMTNDCGLFINAGGNLIVGSTLLDPNLDADGDGLPNGWEQAHGLNPLSGIGKDGADGDPDGDGLTNMEELDLGTDPTDPTSPYHITSIVRQGNNIRVSWQTVGGRINVMQATARIVGSFSSSFSDLSPQIVAPGVSVSSTNYLDVGGATNKPSRFYRVRIVK